MHSVCKMNKHRTFWHVTFELLDVVCLLRCLWNWNRFPCLTKARLLLSTYSLEEILLWTGGEHNGRRSDVKNKVVNFIIFTWYTITCYLSIFMWWLHHKLNQRQMFKMELCSINLQNLLVWVQILQRLKHVSSVVPIIRVQTCPTRWAKMFPVDQISKTKCKGLPLTLQFSCDDSTEPVGFFCYS